MTAWRSFLVFATIVNGAAAAISVAQIAGCARSTPPPPYPVVDASDATAPAVDASPVFADAPPMGDSGVSICAQACARLAALGCPEKVVANCAAVLAHVESGRLVRTASGAALTCAAVAAAGDAPAEQALGVCQP